MRVSANDTYVSNICMRISANDAHMYQRSMKAHTSTAILAAMKGQQL